MLSKRSIRSRGDGFFAWRLRMTVQGSVLCAAGTSRTPQRSRSRPRRRPANDSLRGDAGLTHIDVKTDGPFASQADHLNVEPPAAGAVESDVRRIEVRVRRLVMRRLEDARLARVTKGLRGDDYSRVRLEVAGVGTLD